MIVKRIAVSIVLVLALLLATTFTVLAEDSPTGELQAESLGVGQAGTTLTADITAVANWTRTVTWDISKGVTPAVWDMFRGDSGTSTYTVGVTKYVTEAKYFSGQVCINNGGAVATEGLTFTVSVTVPPSTTVLASTTVTPATQLASGATQCYPFQIDYAGITGGVNYKFTADVTITNHSGSLGVPKGPSPSTDYKAPSSPTLIGYENINVTDTNGGSWAFSGTGSVSYTRTFTCDDDAGSHGNTATITQTGQHAEANVVVHCYALTVTKDAFTSYTRSYTWDIDKSVSPSSLTLALGQNYLVAYDVSVSAIYADSLHEVHGSIVISNPAPMVAPLASVTDVVSPAISATVICPSLSVPAEGSLTCTYSADLPDATNRLNTATATLQNTPTGTTNFTATADVEFAATPTVEIDECIYVSDTLKGALGPVCYGDLPETFSYTSYVGPYETCGEYTVDNVASFVANDTAATGDDSASVAISVPCNIGCTLTIGYWKNHAGFGPQADMVTPLLPQHLGSQVVNSSGLAVQFLSFYGSNNIFSASNGINKLYAQLLAAKLNIEAGADGSAIAATISMADSKLSTWNSTSWAGLSKANKNLVLLLVTNLDRFNNGLLGPGHCSQ